MIVIIDNYDSFTYNLYQLVAQFTDEVKVIRNDKITLAQLAELNPNGIILSPGPGRPETAGICIELIKKFKGIVPILGVCLGHQAIAVAFGGEVGLADEIVHGKADLIHHNQQGLYQKITSPFKAARYHSLIAMRESLPQELQIEAKDASGAVMGFRHKEYPIYGVQFHPESILTPQGNRFIENFVDICDSGEIEC